MQMHVYLQPDVTEEQIQEIQKQIEENPNSGEVTYSSKDEQLKLVTESFGESSALITEYFSFLTKKFSST